MDPERQRIINDAARIANDIDQQLIDVAYWNELHPKEVPIDADPDGQLRRWKRGFESLLRNEAQIGNFPSVIPLKAHRRKHIPVQMTKEMRKVWFSDEDKN